MTLSKKKSNNQFSFQPELATSVIYWSLTFASFFIGLILLLEQFRVTVWALAFFLSFLALVHLGRTRYFYLKAEHLAVKQILRRNSQEIPVELVSKVSVGSYGLTIEANGWQDVRREERTFLMSAKTKERFVAALASHPDFQGEIVGIKNSVGK